MAIFDALEQLPEPYTKALYDQKCELVYQHVYEAYIGGIQGAYGQEPSMSMAALVNGRGGLPELGQ